MNNERTLTIRECAEMKITEAAQILNEIQACPDEMFTEVGLDGLNFVKDVMIDLTSWLEEKRQVKRLHVLPAGE